MSFFFQAEDGIRDTSVTGVQTCALPICQLTADVQQVTSWPANDVFPQFQTSFSVVHSARFQALAAAPDQVVTLFGVHLAGPAQQASSLPLPIMLAGASVSIK